MSTMIEPSPPVPGLVCRIVNGVERWVHELTGETHSLFRHIKTVINEVEAITAKDTAAGAKSAGAVSNEALTTVAEKL